MVLYSAVIVFDLKWTGIKLFLFFFFFFNSSDTWIDLFHYNVNCRVLCNRWVIKSDLTNIKSVSFLLAHPITAMAHNFWKSGAIGPYACFAFPISDCICHKFRISMDNLQFWIVLTQNMFPGSTIKGALWWNSTESGKVTCGFHRKARLSEICSFQSGHPPWT